MRGHQPVTIEEFNGLWKRGDADSCPPDHFSDCNNLRYSESSVLSRDGIGPLEAYRNVKRIYVFNQSLLILDSDGNIYHDDRPNRFTPILSIPGMNDFGFVKYANHAYISPVGLGGNDFIYVYTYGDTNGARKAAGKAPTTAPVPVVSSANGNCEQGIHVISVVYETDTGFLTGLSPRATVAVPAPDPTLGGWKLDITIPISPDFFVKKRHVVATKAIDPADFTGDLNGYQFFFVSDGVANDNTSTLITVSFFDAELLEDASHLDDLYDEIPNQSGLNLYHNRLIGWASSRGNNGQHLSEIIVSSVGEPEAIDKVDGLIALTPDGKPITFCQEFRDTLYVYKATKTFAAVDNQDVPSSWPVTLIDAGIGPSAHGLATVMDAEGANIDYLLIADITGLITFNGTYQFPPLSYKVRDYWRSKADSGFTTVQIVVNSQEHFIYIAMPDGTMLVGDYNNGFTFEKIKWTPFSANVKVTCLAILEITGGHPILVIGSREAS